MSALPAAISDWSVLLAPRLKTGTEQICAPLLRLKTTMFIGSALSVIATHGPVVITVGVVPDPACVCPGFTDPMFGYVRRHTTRGVPSGCASKRYSAASV